MMWFFSRTTLANWWLIDPLMLSQFMNLIYLSKEKPAAQSHANDSDWFDAFPSTQRWYPWNSHLAVKISRRDDDVSDPDHYTSKVSIVTIQSESTALLIHPIILKMLCVLSNWHQHSAFRVRLSVENSLCQSASKWMWESSSGTCGILVLFSSWDCQRSGCSGAHVRACFLIHEPFLSPSPI